MVTLTLKGKYHSTSVEFTNSDVSLEQYFTALKALLIQETWSEKTIDNYIVELAEDINKDGN